MNSCKNLAKKYPLAIVVLTLVLLYALISLLKLVPDWELVRGTNELILAIIMFALTFLFMGKEKVILRTDGFGYAFRMFRTYFIFLAVMCAITVTVAFTTDNIPSNILYKLIDVLLLGLSVGIVEEFSFRGLVFGGIIQKTGNNKKGIIIAAVVSGLLFGVMHIISAAIEGNISNIDSLILAILKTLQTGIFGVILAFIYIKTRNIYAVVALHCLDDTILFIMSAFGKGEVAASDYVSGNVIEGIVGYVFFTVILIPVLVKCIKDIEESGPMPFEDGFDPRKVKYIKKNKSETL